MSKTFRRKGFEATRGGSWRVEGSKTSGFYTIEDRIPGTWISEYRAPSQAEFHQKFWTLHSDNPHWRDPYTGQRKMRAHRKARRQAESELRKFVFDEEYEPIVYDYKIYETWY